MKNALSAFVGAMLVIVVLSVLVFGRPEIEQLAPPVRSVGTTDVNLKSVSPDVAQALAQAASQPTTGQTVPPPQAPAGGAVSVPSGASILTPEMAEAWCPKGCAGRFEQLVEANGVTNPRGVHLKTGNPVPITIPAGVSGQVWDCFNASQVTGPASLPQVCEASFRQ